MALRKKKKKIKVDPDGIAYIKATFNNTLVTLADKFGNVITWSSAGALGFKGSRKNTPFAATQAAQKAANRSPRRDRAEAIGDTTINQSSIVIDQTARAKERLGGRRPRQRPEGRSAAH